MNRALIALTLALLAAGCADGIGPQPAAVTPPLYDMTVSSPGTHVLRQAPTAPRLQTYQVSFWARRGTQTTIFVNYRRAPGEWLPDPFLRFRIPINGLVAGAGGVPLARGDSVRITLTIDSVLLNVDFQPSGVVFSDVLSAGLVMWYVNANPDLNGDGVVDSTDQMLEGQLALSEEPTKVNGWFKVATKNDTTQKFVATDVYHFSQYAVAW